MEALKKIIFRKPAHVFVHRQLYITGKLLCMSGD